MAELDDFISGKVLDQQKQFYEGVKLSSKAINELLDSLVKLSKAQNENKTTAQALTEERKKQDKLDKQLETAKKKEAAALEKTTVAYQRKVLAQQKAVKAAKDEARAEGAARDSLVRKRMELNKLTQGYDKMSASARAKAAPAIKALSKEIETAEKATNRNQRAVGRYEDAISKMPGPMGAAANGFVTMTKAAWAFIATGIGAVIAVVAGAFLLLKEAVTVAADYEEQMDKVAAITGATASEMDALSESAKRLGATTTKTATEVGQLQEEFSKLGFTVQEILNATEATIALSEATGEDLAQSAKVAAATLRGFGLDASETQRVVDVMAKSFSSSALDLSKFETAMAQVAPVAKTSGISIERATSFLGKLVDAGLDASTAGTSVRNMLLENAKSGRTFDEALELLNESTNKNADAMDLFGKRGAIAAIVLADNVEKTNELEQALVGAGGSAKKMADIMKDNLAGDVKSLSSAWEGFLLSVEDGEGIWTDFTRGAIQGLTDLVRWVTNFGENTKLWFEELKIRVGILADQYVIFANKAEIVALKAAKLFAFGKADNALEQRIEGLQNKIDELGDNIEDSREELIELEKKSSEEIQKNQDIQVDAIKKANTERLRAALDTAEELKKIEKGITDEAIKESEKRIAERSELRKTKERVSDEEIAKERERLDIEEDDKKRLREEIAFEATAAGLDLIFEKGQRKREAELLDLEAKLAAGQITEEQYNKKKEAIDKKQARANKRRTISEIILNTFSAVVQALPNVPLSIAVGAIGAINLAKAIATPAYASGTYGKYNTPGSGFIAGEAGTEIRETQSGQQFLVDKPTFFQGSEFANNRIIPNGETKMLMAGNSTKTSNNDQLIKSLIFETKKNGKKMANQKSYGYHITARGIEAQFRHGKATSTRMSRFLD